MPIFSLYIPLCYKIIITRRLTNDIFFFFGKVVIKPDLKYFSPIIKAHIFYLNLKLVVNHFVEYKKHITHIRVIFQLIQPSKPCAIFNERHKPPNLETFGINEDPHTFISK